MHFALSEEQAELASTIRSLLDRRSDPAAVRAATESEAGHDPELWRTLVDQVGVAALAIPEAHGGAGFTLFETAVVLEELGRNLAPTPLLPSLLAAEALLASGDEDAWARLLPRIASGAVATVAWDGVGGRDAVSGPAFDGAVVTGSVDPVLYGDLAEVLLVVAVGPDGPVLLEVEPDAAQATWRPGMDQTLRFAELRFDAAPARVLAEDAGALLDRLHQVGSAATAALAVGCLQRALDMTVAHSLERVQFGRQIGSFQALKHRMADMLVLVETSRSASWAASYAVAERTTDAATLVAAAGSWTGDALADVSGEMVQIHGGIAITWEHDAHLVFKRAHALGQLFGQPHQHRATLLD